jgi:LysR family glycine cleavage system transcriptional activator
MDLRLHTGIELVDLSRNTVDVAIRYSESADETHAIQAAIAGQGVAIVSSLLAQDFIEKGILSTPFLHHLPGANYYLVTTKEKAERANIVILRRWLLDKMSTIPRM